MGETDKILDITKSLSDKLRLKIVSILASGRSKRYIDILNDLGMDAVADSSKLAYHMGVLVESGIVEKVGDRYAITPGGKEVFWGMVRVSENWDRFGYKESLKNIKGHEVVKLIYARTFLGVSLFWLLFPLGMWYRRGYEYAIFMTAVGLVTLSIGAYWILSLKGLFDNDIWKTYFSIEACKAVIGENRKVIDNVTSLSVFGNQGLLFLTYFIASENFSIWPLGIIGYFIFITVLVVSVYRSRVIPFYWNTISEIKLALDFSEKIEFHSYLVLGFLTIIGIVFITLGISQLAIIGEIAFGYIGAGGGCIGSAVRGWMKFKKQYYGLTQ